MQERKRLNPSRIFPVLTSIRMSHNMAVKVKRFKQSDLLLDSIAIFGHLNQDLFFLIFPTRIFWGTWRHVQVELRFQKGITFTDRS